MKDQRQNSTIKEKQTKINHVISLWNIAKTGLQIQFGSFLVVNPEKITFCRKIYTLMLHCSEVAQFVPHSILRGGSLVDGHV